MVNKVMGLLKLLYVGTLFQANNGYQVVEKSFRLWNNQKVKECTHSSEYQNIFSTIGCSALCLREKDCEGYTFNNGLCHVYTQIVEVEYDEEFSIYVDQSISFDLTSSMPTSTLQTTTTSNSLDQELIRAGFRPSVVTGKYVKFPTIEGEISKTDAKQRCLSDNGELMVVGSGQEAVWLKETLQKEFTNFSYWIGLRRKNANDDPKWSDETAFVSYGVFDNDDTNDSSSDKEAYVQFENNKLSIKFAKNKDTQDGYICQITL